MSEDASVDCKNEEHTGAQSKTKTGSPLPGETELTAEKPIILSFFSKNHQDSRPLKMVDTRCADPDLQLDVDIMILEYTLHQAVKAQFDFLSCASGCRHDEDEATTKAKAISSTRVLSIFDSFITYFNATYPSHVKSTGFFDNLDMLEFLVLLSSRSSSSATTTIQFSDNMPEKLRQVSSNNLAARRRWLVARERQTRKLSKQPQPQPAYSSSAAAAAAAGNFSTSIQDDVEDQICNAWNQNQHQHDFRTSPAAAVPTSNNPQLSLPLPLLFDLIPRFMDVSAEISALLGHRPNETWMHIAGQFMLQASLEALQIRTTSTRHLVHGNDTHNHTLTRALPRLDDCFAWGYVDPSYLLLAADVVAMPDGSSASANPSSDDKSKSSHDLDDEMVQLVNELFCDPHPSEPTDCSQSRTDSSSSCLRLKETPEWTSIRTTYLSEFSIAPDASTSSQSCRLDRLTTKYPLAQFLDELISFMRNIWDLFCTQLHAKPVLAQIEEDGCLSLSLESTLGTTSGIGVQKGVEFDGFLARVGLNKKNGNGILSLDRLDDEPELGLRHQSQPQPLASGGGGFVSSGNAWSQAKLRLRPSI
ncbi:hypothetical protein LTS15_006226 [Exophiala xenobiotica]|nr:hypothetical protein LTS15_006226 [Exophiala xenobiotica]